MTDQNPNDAHAARPGAHGRRGAPRRAARRRPARAAHAQGVGRPARGDDPADLHARRRPVARQVGAKAAELAALAAVKAGPVAQKAAELTTDYGQRFAEQGPVRGRRAAFPGRAAPDAAAAEPSDRAARRPAGRGSRRSAEARARGRRRPTGDCWASTAPAMTNDRPAPWGRAVVGYTLRAMSVKPIVLLGDPRLRLKGETVDSFGKYLHELLDDLTDSMRHAPGVGLAAPQLGEAVRACVIEVEGNLHELVNPEIVRAAGDDRDLEGCLSIPGYVAYVTRREKVWVVAQNRLGKKIKVAGSGLLGPGAPARAGPPQGKLYIDYLDSMEELIPVASDGDDDDDAADGADEAGSIGRRAPWRDAPGRTAATASGPSSSAAGRSARPRCAGSPPIPPSSSSASSRRRRGPSAASQVADRRRRSARLAAELGLRARPDAAPGCGRPRPSRRSSRCGPRWRSSPTTGRSCRRRSSTCRTAPSTCTRRRCPAGAAPRRSRRRSSPATAGRR